MPSKEIRKHPLLAFETWRSMHKRCYHPKTNGFKYYGGRGIKVHPDWFHYEVFIADMGLKPSPKHALDRIDTDGDYEKTNCRWVTVSENERNKDYVVEYTYNGEKFVAKELAALLGFAESTFLNRVKKWGLEEAINRPHGPTGPKRGGKK